MSTTNRAFYDERYHYGEDVDRPNPERLWRALGTLEPLNGKRLLDLGSGVGWATALAGARGGVANAIGLDFSETAIRLAAEREKPRDQIAWVVGDGMTLPFRDGTFDRVFSFGSMEHFPDVRQGFREMARVLAPDGLGATVVPNFYIKTAQPIEHRDTLSGWKRIIQDAGLTVVRVAGDPGPAIFKNRRPLRIALRLALRAIGSLPPLRYQFIFLVRKA
ncbi:MAG TPA: class I SAM-dependent methyltransferase [Gemmatimonadaceae bacterium]|nr:class I SAM-dependent methyltransferase [Gemmatimonadaceae bacterium]